MPGALDINEEGSRARLVPEMSSRRWQVLAFVRDYIGRMGGSPSYGEIAAALGTNRTRVKEAVRGLVREGHLVRVGRERGLTLPGDLASAIRTLRSFGYRINEEIIEGPVGEARAVTISTLLRGRVLDYFPDQDGDGNAGIDGGAGR